MNSNQNRKQNYQNVLKKLRRIEILISSVCMLGMFISLYALKVEIYKEKYSRYKALCDINEWISCSKVFSSKYGKGFGIFPQNSIFNQPDSIYGIIFYIIQLVCLLFRNNKNALKLKIFLAVLANFGSVYLAYILKFVLQDFCIVCVSLYILNAILLVFNVLHYNYYENMKTIIINTTTTTTTSTSTSASSSSINNKKTS